MYTITIDYDQDADFSWLDQDEFKDENPADHIALEVALYDEEGKLVDSLSGIDFLEAGDDWVTGKFHDFADIPEQCDYLREIACDLIATLNHVECRRYLSVL